MTDEQDIKALQQLPVGWDGYQGRPVSEGSCHLAIKIAEALKGVVDADAQFVPGADGDIQVEYHHKDFIVEIYIQVNL